MVPLGAPAVATAEAAAQPAPQPAASQRPEDWSLCGLRVARSNGINCVGHALDIDSVFEHSRFGIYMRFFAGYAGRVQGLSRVLMLRFPA